MKKENLWQIYRLGILVISFAILGFIFTPVVAQNTISPVAYTKFGMEKPNIIPYVSSIASKNNTVYLTYEKWNGTSYVNYLIGIDPDTGRTIVNHTIDISPFEYISSITSYNDEIYLLHENYTQVGNVYHTTEIVTRLTSSYTVTKVLSFNWNSSNTEIHSFTYDETYTWFGTSNFSGNNSYLCAVDNHGNIIKNITFTPNNEANVKYYYLRSIHATTDNILILDTDGILWRYNKATDDVVRVFNVTDSLVPQLINKEQMDAIKPLSITTEGTVLWIAVDGIQIDLVTHSHRTFHYLVTYDLNQIIPSSNATAPVVGGTLDAASAGGVVSSAVSATAIVVGTASVAAATSAGTTTATTGSSAIAIASQAGGEQTNFLKQLKDLFSLRKLMGLFKRKKKKKQGKAENVSTEEVTTPPPVSVGEMPVKPNFSLGAGIIALFGLVSGIALGMGANAYGGFSNIFAIIGATVGFPLAIFGIITSGFVLFLYLNKELTLKTITLLIILVSFAAALYGLYSSTFALFGYLIGAVVVVYLVIAIAFGLIIAGTQLYNFINTLPET